jgi:hypothetical protein
MENGYYEDLNGRIYKVEDDCISEKVEDTFKPLLYPQNFAMCLKMGLLTKKDIVELELEQLSIPLYLNGDCPEEKLPMTPEQEIQMLLGEADKLDREVAMMETDIDARKEMLERYWAKIEELEG